tara:strand:- start:727 stop:939 length:213 start_codon:yes stop_codon:yes gene_type:complete
VSNLTEEKISQEQMDQLVRNPYQLLEDRIINLETERDEINVKLDAVGKILIAFRVAFGDMPLPKVEKEDE